MFRFGCLYLIMSFGSQCAAGSPVTVTEYQYVQEADAWLRLHIVPATWSDAAVRCQFEGGILATPKTSAMTEAMLKTMGKHKLASKNVFIGITDILSKGNFRSLDGAGLDDNLEWPSGEPNDAGNGEHCLALTSAGATIDVSCARVLPYFCRKSSYNFTSTSDMTSTTPSKTPCGSNGYQWEPRTASCYKFHGAAKLWHRAAEACNAEGGHLAIINSDSESTVLKELYKEYANTITGAEQPKHAFIGFRRLDDGVWATINGQTLAKAGFAKWDVGEPNNGSGGEEEYCGTIHRNGLLNDGSCIRTSPFICEITPSTL